MSYYLVSLGSNIQAHIYLPKALILINKAFQSVTHSQVLINPACGDYFNAPFHNQLLLLQSTQTSQQIKATFEQLEIQLGREAKSPERKFKDRTIDIDILSQADTAEEALATPLEETYNQKIMQDWQRSLANEALMSS